MLHLEDLHYRYAGASQPALAGVSLTVAPGQVLGLLGPNGAGKTTLISMLADILPLQRGRIEVDGLPLAQMRRQSPASLAVAPQEFAFYPSLSVRENLRCFAAACGASRVQERVTRALEFGQLQRFAQARAETLSGGLKRRLNLAITTLAEPRYILLDEPTVGVDPQSRAFLLAAVKQLAEGGMGVIYTSHYMEEVQALADQVVIIDHGRVLCQGPLAQLLAQGQMLLRFAQTGLSMAQLATLLAEFGQLQAAAPDGSLQLLLHPSATPAQALSALERSGGRVAHAEFGRFDLEQLFMQLTNRSLRD